MCVREGVYSLSLFINNCIIFHMKNCKPAFAHHVEDVYYREKHKEQNVTDMSTTEREPLITVGRTFFQFSKYRSF